MAITFLLATKKEFSKKKWLSYNIDIDNISKVVDKLIDHERWRGGWDHIKEKMKSC